MPRHIRSLNYQVKGIENPNLTSSEVKSIFHKLSLGNLMTNFSISKKKPEQRTFFVSMFKNFKLAFFHFFSCRNFNSKVILIEYCQAGLKRDHVLILTNLG